MSRSLGDRPTVTSRLDRRNNRAIIDVTHEPRLPTGIDVVLQRGNITIHFPDMPSSGDSDGMMQVTPEMNSVVEPAGNLPAVAATPPAPPTTKVEIVSYPFGVLISYDTEAERVSGKMNVRHEFDPRMVDNFNGSLTSPEPVTELTGPSELPSVDDPLSEDGVVEKIRELLPEAAIESRDGAHVEVSPDLIDSVDNDSSPSALLEATAAIQDGQLSLFCRRSFVAVGTATNADIVEGTPDASNTNRRQTVAASTASKTFEIPFPVSPENSGLAFDGEEGAEVALTRAVEGQDGIIGAIADGYGPLSESGRKTEYSNVSSLIPPAP